MCLSKSIVLIQSKELNNNRFGTGFVIHKSGDSVYVLTCAHVVRDVGGENSVQIEGYTAKVKAIGEEESLDLAVLCVEALFDRPPLRLSDNGTRGDDFSTEGYQLSVGHLLRPLHGRLGEELSFYSTYRKTRIKAWEIHIEEENILRKGFSGSPVVDKEGDVLAVVSQRLNSGKSGSAISIENLELIWTLPDADKSYNALLKLGYQEQVNLFRKLAKKSSTAAFLIHGPSEHGQRWLLKRLVTQYMPQVLDTKPINIIVGARSRSNTISALWRELGVRFGIRGSSATPTKIIQNVYKAWHNRDIIIVMEYVHLMPEAELKKLIQDFWLPLAETCNSHSVSRRDPKLYMFLIDYDGVSGELNIPLVEKIDLSKRTSSPIKSPKLRAFEYEELEDWILEVERDLSPGVIEQIDNAVDDILKSSDGGIPEFVLIELCDRFGLNWYDVKDDWLKL